MLFSSCTYLGEFIMLGVHDCTTCLQMTAVYMLLWMNQPPELKEFDLSNFDVASLTSSLPPLYTLAQTVQSERATHNITTNEIAAKA